MSRGVRLNFEHTISFQLLEFLRRHPSSLGGGWVVLKGRSRDRFRMNEIRRNEHRCLKAILFQEWRGNGPVVEVPIVKGEQDGILGQACSRLQMVKELLATNRLVPTCFERDQEGFEHIGRQSELALGAEALGVPSSNAVERHDRNLLKADALMH